MKKKTPISEGMKFALAITLIVGLGWLTFSKVLLINQNPIQEDVAQLNIKTPQKVLAIGSAQIMAEVRQSEAELELGLSYRPSMGETEGMIFIYKEPQKVLYWMKGMQFPLDFIFVVNKRIVEIVEQVSEPSRDNPVEKTVVPTQLVDMVIEVNAGWVSRNQVKVGDLVNLGE